MNLFQIATRGIDLDSLPEPAPEQMQIDTTTSVKAPSDFDKVFSDAGDAYGVDPAILKSMALAESAFNPDIISGKVKSRAGAIGLMQLMKGTADEYGIDPTNPVEAIFGAAAYMRKSLDKFGGDYGRAVASYNSGAGLDAYRHEDWDARLPPETQVYLSKVFGAVDQVGLKPAASQAKTEATQLPAGVTPSTAGAGRGAVSPGMTNTKLVRSAVPEMTAESVGRDVASGVLQIGPTAVQGVGDLLSLATGNRVGGELREFAKSGKQAIQEVVGSKRAQAQAQNLAADMADDSVGLADLVANNKGALADQILPTLGSMAIPLGAAGAAGKLATAGKAAQGLDKVGIAARVASAQQAAGIGATAAQNAASTFAELLDKGVPMQDAYVGAGITVPFSLIAGKLTGGGAEGALIRGMGPAGAARGVAEAALKAPAREGLQEGGEALGQVLGEAGATSTLPTLNAALKQVGTEALLGAVVGGGTSGAQQLVTPRVEAQPTTPTVPQVAQPSQAVTQPNSDAAKTQAVNNIAAAILEAEGATAPVAPVTQPEKQAASFAQRTATPTPLPGAVPPANAADAVVRSLVDGIKKKLAQDAEETAQIQQMLAEDDAKAEALVASSMEETARGQATQIAIQARTRLVDDLVSSYAEPSEFFASRVLPAVDKQLAVLGRPPLAKEERARVDALLGSTRAFIRPSLPSAPEAPPVLTDVWADNSQLESLIKPKKPAMSGIGAELAAWKARQQSANPDRAPETPAAAPATQPVTGGLAAEMAAIKARSQSTITVDHAKPAPVGIGRGNTPLSEGGKPFKTKAEADTARKLQPMMRVKKQGKGFVLVEKTAAQIAAQEKAARRNLGSVGAGGGPLSAHAFLASQGGLSKSAMADLGLDKNVRVGSKWLFTNTGMTLEGMTEALQQNGYVQGTEQNPAIELVRRSANGQPQYTADGWDQIAQAEATARFEDHLAAQQDAMAEDEDFDPFSPEAIAGEFEGDDLVVAGYDDASPSDKAEFAALLAAAEADGIDTEAILEQAAQQTQDGTNADYQNRALALIAAARSQRVAVDRGANTEQGRQDAQRESTGNDRAGDGREGAPGADGEGLTTYTPAEVTARQDAAAEVEATAKRAEDAASRAEAAAKQASEIAQRSVAAADTFELGGNAEDNLSGQEGLRFSSANQPTNGITTEAAQKIVDGITAQWKNAPEVVVLADLQDVKAPKAVRDYDAQQRSQGAEGEPEGFWYKGKAYVVAGALNKPDDVARVLMHEALGHYGLRGVFGDDIKPILRQVAMMRQKDVAAKAEQYGLDVNDEAGRLHAAEEVLAEMAQSNPDAGVVKRAIAAIRAWMRKHIPGFRNMALTDSDIISNYLLPARNFVVNGGRDGGQDSGVRFQRSESAAQQAKYTADTITVDGKERPTTNSNGKPIADTEQGLVNFWRWFGDSKVVDADGNPLVVYHGTRNDFSEFDARATPVNGLRYARGFYMTADPDYASMMSRETSGSRVMPVFVSLKNPKVFESVQDANALRAAQWGKIESTHDGVIIQDEGSMSEVIAFSPTQIKSATGNNGNFDPANPDIRFSRGAGSKQDQQNLALNDPSPAWMLPKSTKADALVYELQDQKVDLKRTQEAIAEAGRTITEPFDARMAETLMPGRVAYRTETFLKTEVAPLMEAMAKNNVTQNELSDYLLARHAPERNAQIAKVNPEMPDGGAGTNSQGVLMTTQAAQDHIAALTTGKRMVLQLLANKIDAITASTRDLLVREGLEKQSTMDAWTGAYKHYVPLFKDEAVESPAHPIGSGMSVTGSASKRAMGSEGEVTNMVAHILMQREAAITRAEKNRVAMSLYGLALSNPNKDVWSTIRPSMSADKIGAELAAMGVDPVEAEQGMQGVPTIRTINAVTGLVQETPNPMYKRLDNALVVKVDGEDRVILFNAKNADAMRMARALKNQDGLTNFDLAGSMVGTATRYLASINTQYNPAFGMVNVVRDIGGALVNLTTTGIADQKAKVLGDIPAAMKGIARDVRGDQARTPWSDLWVQFQEDGGRTGYRDLFIDPFKRAEAVQKDLDAMQRDGTASAGRVAHSILDLMDDFNTTLENGVRLSAYKAALDKGMSRPAAAKMARELTVDFNRKGRMGREIGPLYAFFNASVQGTARTIESLKGPAGKKIIAGGLMLGVIQSLMLAAAGFDDDEPPDFVKARSFIIPMGDKRYIAIPLQFGLNALPNTGRVITDLFLTGGKDWQKKSFEALGEVMGSFNPLGGGNIFTAHGLLTTVAPTVADPLIDLATNTNFASAPIGKDRADWDTRPGDKLARESTKRSLTGQAYIGISKAVNALSGGNEFKRGLASPTPEQVQYVFTTAGGGLYRELEKTLNIAGLKADGFEIKARMIPLGGRFAGEIDDQDTQRSRYYRNSERLAALEAELKGFEKADDEAAVRRIETERSDEVDLLGDYKHIRQSITKLNKLAADNINDVEMLKELDAERLELMRELNDSVRKLEKRSELFEAAAK